VVEGVKGVEELRELRSRGVEGVEALCYFKGLEAQKLIGQEAMHLVSRLCNKKENQTYFGEIEFDQFARRQ
jgi:hypothetical protein